MKGNNSESINFLFIIVAVVVVAGLAWLAVEIATGLFAFLINNATEVIIGTIVISGIVAFFASRK
ncbi:MAG: hypothetical protein AB2692_19385 [Candidatus Thiodiazotropha sp.]